MLIEFIEKNKKLRGRKSAGPLMTALFDSKARRDANPVANRMERTISLGGKTLNLYFGDIHGHSDLSPDSFFFSPEHYYRFGRDVSMLDFSALTDHDAPWGMAEHPKRWRESREATEQFNEPGRFATFHAYEWTSGDGLVCMRHHAKGGYRWHYLDEPRHFGHRNVYFPTGDVPDNVFSVDDPEYDTPEKLWDAVKPFGAITIPHHPLGGPVWPFDWKYFNEEMEPVVEIYSSHGSSECENAPHEIYNPYHNGLHSVRTPLDEGRHFGFIGSSDCHQARPGNYSYPCFLVGWCKIFYGRPERLPGPGLIAVYAEELTRESIFEAIRARRTYAVTGARIALDVRADGHFMGSRFSAARGKKVKFTVDAESPVELSMVEIIKNGEVVETILRPGNSVKLVYIDEKRDTDSDYIYARLTQADTQMAWSSPIRIDAKDETAKRDSRK